jgi:hypothetical protein
MPPEGQLAYDTTNHTENHNIDEEGVLFEGIKKSACICVYGVYVQTNNKK